MAIYGIDIFNGNSDAYNFTRARGEGVSFVIHKASQGWIGGTGGWVDWKFVGAIQRARAAGMPLVGGYHWLLRGNGAAQAQNFYHALTLIGGPRGVLACVDVERNDWNQQLNPDAQTLRDFLAEWDRIAGGQPCIIYSADWYWGPYMGEPKDFAGRPLWWAGYFQRTYSVGLQQAATDVTPGYFTKFGGWNEYLIRQWSSNTFVSGVPSDVDYFPGTVADLQKYTVPQGQNPPSQPVPKPAPNLGTNVRQIQAAVHATSDGIWGPDTDRRCEIVRHKGPINQLQIELGISGDGIWGPVTQAAYTRAVRGIQQGLAITSDGIWGPQTDAKYIAASPYH